MGEHEHLRVAQFPQGMAVLLFILGGTDFFDDFQGDEHSLFYDMGWKKCIWDVWCKHKKLYPNLIMVFYDGPARYNQPEMCRRPYMDEDGLIAFFEECYRAKYAKAVTNEDPDIETPTVDQIRAYTQSLVNKVKSAEEFEAEKRAKVVRANKKKGIAVTDFPAPTAEEQQKAEHNYLKRWMAAKKKAMPPRPVLQRYARLALLNFTYWLNDYRPGGSQFCDPLELYEGMPYYGFVLGDDGYHYKLSPIVSPPRPVPDFVVSYMGMHRRQQEEQEAAAAEQARKDAEETARLDAELAREMEREERQRKLHAKEKRLAQRAAEAAPAPAARRVPPSHASAPKRKRE